MWQIVFLAFCFMLAFNAAQQEDFPIIDFFEDSACITNLTRASAGFHLQKPNLTSGECYWIIAPKINGTIKINIFFHFLFLHENDAVTLYKSLGDAQNGSSPLVNPIQAQNGSVTIITEEPEIVIRLKGNNTSYQRKFSGYYQSQSCTLPIPPDIHLINSPIYIANSSTTFQCEYVYTKDQHYSRRIRVFVFEKFNFTSSSVDIKGSTSDGIYNNVPPIDFFPSVSSKTMTITVNLKVNELHEYFLLRQHFVDNECSGQIEVSDNYPKPLFSPSYVLNNDSITTECRWVIHHADQSKILGIEFQNLALDSVFDMVAINDGPSEHSAPLLQVTTANRNQSMSQIVRTTGPYMWIVFKPVNYVSVFSANVTVHNNGGYHKGNGSISLNGSPGNDTIFLLEVDENQNVMLNFTSSHFKAPATLKVYDDFHGSNLLTSLHGNTFYPVLSRSSQMMVTAENFSSGSFTADFYGIIPGCLHMSTLDSENYILSGNCNRTCMWIIPPQDTPNSVLLLDLQYVSLNKGDHIDILQLDAAKTHLGTVTSNLFHVPQLSIQANVGAIVEITRGACKEENDIVLIGHSSYIPDCGLNLTPAPSEAFQVTSPRYPDTYPLLSRCHWNLSTSNDNLVHLVFNSLKLAPNHCVKITQNSDKKSFVYYGDKLQDDLLLSGAVSIEFDSSGCNKTQVTKTLVSDEGFVLNGTIADCGALLVGKKNGEFNTSTVNNKTLCIWKVSVPATEGSDVCTISYTVSKKDDKQNYEFHVYDGASVRKPEILNSSNTDIWSRSNDLIFVYKRIDVSKPSSVLVIKYNTISCNSTWQCENKICMHPDWRCNGINDCGDFTDELNCASVPIPPELKLDGYSSLAFWLTTMFMIVFGIILGVAVPYFYQRYKNGQYRRFGDISVIE